jgi:hypothetical protein
VTRVAGKFYAALDNDEPWAIQAMRNQFNWEAGRNGFRKRAPVPSSTTTISPRRASRMKFVGNAFERLRCLSLDVSQEI